jgi:hypothetical protein
MAEKQLGLERNPLELNSPTHVMRPSTVLYYCTASLVEYLIR